MNIPNCNAMDTMHNAHNPPLFFSILVRQPYFALCCSESSNNGACNKSLASALFSLEIAIASRNLDFTLACHSNLTLRTTTTRGMRHHRAGIK